MTWAKTVPILMKYYGMAIGEVRLLTPLQVRFLLISMIDIEQKASGAVSGTRNRPARSIAEPPMVVKTVDDLRVMASEVGISFEEKKDA